jgi:hypothetical protein
MLCRWDACVQEIGEVATKQGRVVAFPNLYQHRVGDFELVDQSKPGHRKILVFFLVDPTITVPSASVVPIQRRDWVERTILDARVDPRSLLRRLPIEVVDIILGYIQPISQEEAFSNREQLMEERTLFADVVDSQRFNHSFNLWYASQPYVSLSYRLRVSVSTNNRGDAPASHP